MQIIISPAKKMQIDRDSFPVLSQPELLEKTKVLEGFLKTRTDDQLKSIWNASDKIVAKSKLQLQQMNLTEKLTPAILAFSGIQYQYMAPDLFTQEALDYIQNHLKILSGFYGVLRPFDGVCPYRLELKTKMVGFRDYSLLHFWNDEVAKKVYAHDDVVINLASKQYVRLIKPYLHDNQRMITVDFQEFHRDRWRIIGTHAKMARGEMVRFIAERQIKNPDQLQDFHDFGFKFVPETSTPDHYIFRTKFDFKRR